MNRTKSWAAAQAIANDPAKLQAERLDGLKYSDLRVKLGGRSVDFDAALDLICLSAIARRHDETEAIGRAIIEALVAEIDRRLASEPEAAPLHSFDFWVERDGEDIELVVHVLSWTPGKPAYISGPPEDCYPDEPAEIEWTAEYPDGRSAESLLTPEEAERIDAEAILRMSELDTAERESYRYDERDQFAYGDEE